VIAFITKYPYLGLRDLSLDEPFTLFHSQYSISEIVKLSSKGEPHPPLFMLLVHWWNLWADYDVAKLRLLPLLFHALTAPALFFTGKKFFGLWAGIFAVGLFLVNNLFFYYSIELRGYGLFSLLSISALYFYFSATKKPNFWNLGFLLLCNVLLIYNHYFALLIIGVQGLCALFYIKDKRVFIRLLIVLLVTALLFSPLLEILVNQFSKSSEGTWIKKPHPTDYKFYMWFFLNGSQNCKTLKALLIIGLVGVILFKRISSLDKRLLVALIWWFVPYTFMFLLSHTTPVFIDRYLLFNSMGVFIFSGACLACFYHNKWLQAGIVCFVLIQMNVNRVTISDGIENYCKREHSKAISFINQHQDQNTVVGVYPPWVKYHFSFHYDLQSFKQLDNLVPALEEKNVIVSWGAREYFNLADEISADKVILFTNNGFQKENELIKRLQTRFPNRENHTFKQQVEVIILSK